MVSRNVLSKCKTKYRMSFRNRRNGGCFLGYPVWFGFPVHDSCEVQQMRSLALCTARSSCPLWCSGLFVGLQPAKVTFW